MAIAYDTFTDCNNNAGTFSHTPVGTPRAVFVMASHPDNADFITGVTYGGVAMSRVNAFGVGFGSQSTSYIYFLGSNIPAGTQSVVISGTAHGGHSVIVTYTGSADTEIIDFDGEASSTGGAQDVSHVMSHSGRLAASVVAFVQGGGAGWTALTGETTLAVPFYINSAGGFIRQTTPSTSDFTAGYHCLAGQAYTLCIATFSEILASGATRSFTIMT